MRKPHFGLVILVLTVLTAFGVIAKEFKPLIPPGKPNSLAYESGEFVRRAAYQKASWFPLDATAFREARRQAKPILLVIGTPWSRAARDFDERIFSEVDVAALMERSFVSVRVDGSVDPYWLNALAPISRPAVGAIPDFQIWLLTPDATPFDAMLFRGPASQIDAPTMIQRLLEALRLLKTQGSDESAATRQGAFHQTDLELLEAEPAKTLPDFEAHAAVLAEAQSLKYGGFRTVYGSSRENGYQRLLPNALRFYLLRREYGPFRAAADHALRGCYVDWIDGGFFLRSLTEDWSSPQYDKLAVHNAEMMHALALAGHIMNEPYYTYLAKRTFDSLAGEFMDRGLVRACRVGDEDRALRSRHSSFPPRILRQLEDVDGIDVYDWARKNLGLTVETNPRMVCRMADPRIVQTQRKQLEIVLEQLRKSAQERPAQFAGEALAEVNLLCAAKMIAVARLWGDRERMAKATRLFDACNDFLVGNDVVRGLTLVGRQSAYLGDYLAYADAALQDFLANGRVVSLQQGLRVLRRARELFRTAQPGLWAMSTETPNVPDCNQMPEIADTTHESCSARVIRLGNIYGRLFCDQSDKPNLALTTLASQLAQDAYSTMERFAEIAEAVGPTASGYYAASFALLNNAHAFAVGPDAAERAARLHRLVPMRLVAPCLGDVRPDLANKKPGYYVVDAGDVIGPLSLEQAAKRLSN